MNKKIQYTYIFIFFFSVIFSYFLKIDISNGGASRDLYYHWNYDASFASTNWTNCLTLLIQMFYFSAVDSKSDTLSN